MTARSRGTAMSDRQIRLSVALVLSVLSAGCAVGPDFRSPPSTLPDGFARLDRGLSPASLDIAAFWTRFGDPQLDRLVDAALRHNNDLKAALATLNAARAQRRLTRFDQLPTASVGGGYTKQQQSEDLQLPGAPRTTEIVDAGFDVTWELDFFGRVRRSVEASTADLAAAESNLRNAQVLLAANVARSYFELRGAQDQLGVARRNAGNQRTTLDVTQVRLDAGRGTELDTSQARAQLATTLATIPLLEVSVAQAQHRLAVLTGQLPEALIDELASPPAWPALPEIVAIGTPADLLRRRPDIQRAESELHAATARIGVAVGDLFPRVTFSGSIGYAALTGTGLGASGTDTYTLGPGIRWAAFDLGRVFARIDSSRAVTEGALARYQQTVLGALEETENAFIAYTRARARYAHLRDAAEASAAAARLSRLRYEGGISNFLQVLDAERVLLEAEDRESQSRTAMATSLIAIYRALGGGWQDAPLPQLDSGEGR